MELCYSWRATITELYPEVQIRKLHFSYWDRWQKTRQENSRDSDGLWEKRGRWLTTGSESEPKTAESKTSASRERTPTPEGWRL
jgi:hypothetical protein